MVSTIPGIDLARATVVRYSTCNSNDCMVKFDFPIGGSMSLTTAPTTNPAVRIVNGEELPPAGTSASHPSHSQVAFAVRHVMVSKTRGRFSDFAGTVEIGEDPLES